MHSLVVIVPGDLEALTGGYGYDRRIIAGLRNRGWTVAVEILGDGRTNPTDGKLLNALRDISEHFGKSRNEGGFARVQRAVRAAWTPLVSRRLPPRWATSWPARPLARWTFLRCRTSSG